MQKVGSQLSGARIQCPITSGVLVRQVAGPQAGRPTKQPAPTTLPPRAPLDEATVPTYVYLYSTGTTPKSFHSSVTPRVNYCPAKISTTRSKCMEESLIKQKLFGIKHTRYIAPRILRPVLSKHERLKGLPVMKHSSTSTSGGNTGGFGAAF